MVRCYFGKDLENSFKCEYEIEEEVIRVNVEYDIMDEIPSINGARARGSDTHFEQRDIMIVDSLGKRSYLLKNAIYSRRYGISTALDNVMITSFIVHEYFEGDASGRLTDLQSIKISSDAITDCIGHPSVLEKRDEKEIDIM